ncbi:MAG: uroporphyrinogen decarboxylase [Myxococcales bacterium]|nr:MAG: uroporphyrinogen decarboxylase [Myxococcales bacterium]
MSDLEPIFLRACRGQPVPHTPVWLMRQAGRYQPEYRAIRERVSFLELCRSSDLSAEVTVMAVEQLGVDAGIIFADILLVLEPMGLPISFGKDGDGPRIERPVSTRADIDALVGAIDLTSLQPTCDAIRKFRTALPNIPLIGFAGAPFTLASYAIEGGGSKNYVKTKALMYSDELTFATLMERLVDATTLFLNAQIEAGAQVVQLFDSWAGCLSPGDYRRYVLPHMKRLIAGIRPGTPIISFGTGTGGFLEELAAAGASVVGVDWRLEMGEARRRLPTHVLQGNLDPVTLFGPLDELELRVRAIVQSMHGSPGHIFNLGHGILPGTPVATVQALVRMVHELSAT